MPSFATYSVQLQIDEQITFQRTEQTRLGRVEAKHQTVLFYPGPEELVPDPFSFQAPGDKLNVESPPSLQTLPMIAVPCFENYGREMGSPSPFALITQDKYTLKQPESALQTSSVPADP